MYAYRDTGCGGLTEQIPHQGLDPQCEYRSNISSQVLIRMLFTAIILKIRQLSQ